MSIPSCSKEILKSGLVTIISKTYCPYCDKAKSLFKQMGVQYQAFEVDLLEWPEDLVEEFHSLANMRTFPKNFIGEISVGGFTDLQKLQKSGELYQIFESQEISYKKPAF